MPERLPIQPVEKPIICNPYEEPTDHWLYDKETGEASHAGHRRPAGYWCKTERVGTAQARLFTEEERDDLELVNLLRVSFPWRVGPCWSTLSAIDQNTEGSQNGCPGPARGGGCRRMKVRRVHENVVCLGIEPHGFGTELGFYHLDFAELVR